MHRVGTAGSETAGSALVLLPGDNPQTGEISRGGLSRKLEKPRNRSVEARDVRDARIDQTKVSSCGDVEGHAKKIPCPSSSIAACGSLLHDLSNLVAAVLLNANLLGWKLPPYSHLKRPVREIERNAQRAGELLRRLKAQCNTATGHEPPVHAVSAAEQRQSSGDSLSAALVSRELPWQALHLTTACDTRTSGTFPKRDDSSDDSNSGR
jgi:hypothetical protein